ncbi:DnaJ domain-containing protein [Trichothermofontia sp.]
MNLADCYRVLRLRSGAAAAEVKASYRRLARQYHPDANPGDQQAHDMFLRITEAYKVLMRAIPMAAGDRPSRSEPTPEAAATVGMGQPLSALEHHLKQSAYQQLQTLLKQQRFPRAIALVEGLAQRLPQDMEVRQWQAIVYQRWGRSLIKEHQFDKARVYLQKALRVDPHNRSLAIEVQRDLHKLEQVFH